MEQGFGKGIEEQLSGRRQNQPPSKKSKCCLGCIGGLAVLICAVIVISWLASLEPGLSGATYTRTDGVSSYRFDGSEATFSIMFEQNLLEAKLPVIGETQVNVPGDLGPGPFINAFVTLSGSASEHRVRFFAYEYHSGGLYRFDTNGNISFDDSTNLSEFSVSPENLNSIMEKFTEIIQHRVDTPDVNAGFYPVEGEESMGGKAMPRIAQCLRDNTAGKFCVVLNCDMRLILQQGWMTKIAVFPVSYGRTTITVDLDQPNFKSMDYANSSMVRNAIGTGTTVFRIEDDNKFLFNPETDSRWKREE